MKERTLPLQQYARVLPAKGVYGGRVHALHATVGHDGPLAVVRALISCACRACAAWTSGFDAPVRWRWLARRLMLNDADFSD